MVHQQRKSISQTDPRKWILRKPLRRSLLTLSLLATLGALSACGFGSSTKQSSEPRGMQRVTSTAPSTNYYPRMTMPMTEQAAAMLPADEIACRRQLKRIGATFRDIAPINDGGGCGIAAPVQLMALSGNIEIKPAATVTCQMALNFAQWTKSELAPSARFRYFSGIKTIHQGSSYSCRRIRGTSVASEHSKGNAMDVMRIELKNGRDIDVRKPGLFSFRQRGLLNSVRADACRYFTTVLGPGYDADHKDHFHFDIKARRNGFRACR